MSNRGMQILIVVLLVGFLLIGLTGCGKDEPASEPNEAAKTVGATTTTLAVAQTTCPIIENPIDKVVSADYQG